MPTFRDDKGESNGLLQLDKGRVREEKNGDEDSEMSSRVVPLPHVQ